jgi:dolichyl-phosphate-mannose--protein O-mannosyl transferase
MKNYHYVTGILFAIMALAQLARMINHWDVAVGPWSMPASMAWLPFVVFAALCVWSFSSLRKSM